MTVLAEIPRWRRWRIGMRLVLLLLAAVIGYGFAFLLQVGRHGWAFLAALLLGVLSIVEFVLADLVIDSRFPKETREFLDLLRERFIQNGIHDEIVRELTTCVSRFRGCDPSQVSSTVHMRVSVLTAGTDESTPALIQLSDYTKAGLGGRRWRVLESTKGIVGRCLRLERMVWVNFRSVDEYRQRMVEEFGFSQTEIEQHTVSARSYLAYPLQQEASVFGVLYFFSTEPQVFPHASDPAEIDRTAAAIIGLLRAADVM